MSKSRFTHRVDTWVTPEFAGAIEAIADSRCMTASGVVREALWAYLAQLGAIAPRQVAANSQHPAQ